MEENVAWLVGRFAEHVLELRPETALDSGCGAGRLLRALGEAGVRASGVEASSGRVDALVAEGLDARVASADALPFDDRAFDVVAIRHVLHHLPQPAAALAEAVRVARRGLVVAEPLLVPGLPGQDLAIELDAWSKRQDRRRGHCHGPDLAPGEMAGLLPDGLDAALRLEQVLRPRARPVDDVRAQIESRLSDAEGADADEGRLLLRRVGSEPVGCNGSSILVVRLAG